MAVDCMCVVRQIVLYCSEISGNLLIVLKRSRLNLHDIPWGGFNSNTPRQSTFTVSEFVKKIRLTITETKNVSNSQFQTWFSRKTVIPLDTNSRNVSIICLYNSSILLLVNRRGIKKLYLLFTFFTCTQGSYIHIYIYRCLSWRELLHYFEQRPWLHWQFMIFF